ncbi:hypothetical protein LIER_18942 [Lithospermum erythrorhizon]|uniref:Bet v I/Major latex protein domain-containing protein n=1 Tax=Lithospermum erythrorhizon TaxID=34254 RepID=A0AAV3QG13_LITER
MAIIVQDLEFRSSISQSRWFSAHILDGDNLLPKIVPEIIKDVEILEGDGGPGTIKLIHFAEDNQLKNIKHRVDKLDEDSYEYSYSIIEGDALMDVLKVISCDIKIVPSAVDGGSIFKMSNKYHTKGDAQLKEEDINFGKEYTLAICKAIEAYL